MNIKLMNKYFNILIHFSTPTDHQIVENYQI